MSRVIVGVLILGVGVALLAWSAWRLLHPRRPDDVQWQERHRLLGMFLAGVSFSGKPYAYDRVGAISMLLSGVAAIALGILVLVTS